MNDHYITDCPECGQRLRVRSCLQGLPAYCPTCGTPLPDALPPERPLELQSTSALGRRLVVGGIILAVLLGLLYLANRVDFRSSGAAKRLGIARRDQWVTVSYADLLDPNTIVRTGQTLGSALTDPSLRGAVQPFVDRYSYLLQYAVEMLNGPDALPHCSVTDPFPPGSRQPAWVAVLRGGRIHVVSDGHKHARVFLPGETPETAYAEHYSVIRHCLDGLVPPNGERLAVEVFAYTNDYAASELKLNTRAHKLSATKFGPSNTPLNIAGLAEFFGHGPELAGARLDPSEGLVLYGKQGNRQTLAGHDLSLADFVVAYRAAFHPGDNEAFISLDPHREPTKVTVNFGGFLEDTHVGSVVLEADKRFKTITSGLDPNSFRDLRRYVRRYVPSFMSCSERDFLSGTFDSGGKWIGTRFWFYPDNIGVDTDLSAEFAVLTRPQFTADAERSRDDFESREEFETRKATTLSPSIRENIDHLNSHYAEYTAAFPEIRELMAVARLMGIVSWLKEASPQWLDLDALLGVELPAHGTPREKTQMISAAVLAYLSGEQPDSDYVKAYAKVVYLTPMLDSRVNRVFGGPTDVAKYLCRVDGVEPGEHYAYQSEASALWARHKGDKVRDIINTKRDLQAFAEHASASLDPPLPSTLRARQRATWADIENLQIVEIGGGINLEPKHFAIRKAPTSPRLSAFRNVVRSVGGSPRLIMPDGTWIRSTGKLRATPAKAIRLPGVNWKTTFSSGPGRNGRVYAYAVTGQKAWQVTNPDTGSWRTLTRRSPGAHYEESYQADKKILHVAEFKSGHVTGYVVGKTTDKDRIAFLSPGRNNLIRPEEPPLWWPGSQ